MKLDASFPQQQAG